MKAKVNDRFSYDLDSPDDFIARDLGDNRYAISHHGRTCTIEVLDTKLRSSSMELALEGFVFQVCLRDELSEVIRMIRQKSRVNSGLHEVVAPIPGVIKEIHVQNGMGVAAGNPVLTLEAMKMENAIQAPVEGKQIVFHVQISDRVKKGQKLFTIM